MLLTVTVTKTIDVPDWTPEEAAGSTPEEWYETHFATGDASLDSGPYEMLNYDSVKVERVVPPLDAETAAAIGAQEGARLMDLTDVQAMHLFLLADEAVSYGAEDGVHQPSAEQYVRAATHEVYTRFSERAMEANADRHLKSDAHEVIEGFRRDPDGWIDYLRTHG